LVSYNLEDLLSDSGLRSRLHVIQGTAEGYLKKITEIFPEYTPHDIGHKFTVIENLSKLIPLALAKTMNKYEIFFLLSAAYVHDIGMSKLKELGDSEELTDLVIDNIRKNHHIRIRDLLYKHPQLFGLEEQEARYIGKIAMGHRKVDLSDQREFRHYDTFDSEMINIPLLSAFLRLADELDITYKRIPPFLYKYSPPKNPISLVE
jgi:molecular chaperone HtpG